MPLSQRAVKKQRIDKKQRIGHHYDTTFPVVFVAPDFQLDPRIVVFDQEFLVHSDLRKFHSTFFCNFLDSADEVSKGACDVMKGESIKYDWVSVVDGEKEWHLVCKSSKKEPRDPNLFTEDPAIEIRAF
ncbi:uncharacterized protein L3040_007476 [Drepanopeziza brunnea f. sp. 'multigermtubi']|uniref:uncharacterized protein n=1 Tax=Drepanopeziza brunnea f. sp. 'multigermtubi' TaxID=698441 RepID=UPI0023A60D1C|nr:hypothetical protein L3040_007476 [Drepanopeziza brunnea f. sp. 'multigermtubi']